jgi:hypothetical protein
VGSPTRTALIAAVLALAGVADARADASVEVRAVGSEPVPDALVDTLRIYLADSATVAIGAPLAAPTLDARIAEASANLAAGELVTWLERAPDAAGAYTVVVVGERDGRAAVEVGTLDGSDPDALSRLLALRVGAFLDETMAAGPSSPLAAPRPVRRLRPIGELGGGGAFGGDGWQGEAAAAAGVRRIRATHALELVAVARFAWPRDARDGGEQIALDVFDAGAGARVVIPVRRFAFGAGLEVAARRVAAEGMAADGARGAAVRWLPVVRVGLDARLAITPGLHLRLSAGVERGLEVERFTVRGTGLAEVGTLAGVGVVSAVIPLDRE